MIFRALRKLLIKDTPSQQSQVVVLDGTHNDVEVAESYGHTAVPPSDVVHGISAAIGGNSDHQVILAWLDKKYRPKELEDGDSCIYTYEGNMVLAGADGSLTLKTKTGYSLKLLEDGTLNINVINVNVTAQSMTVTSPITTFTGTVRANDFITANSISLNNHKTSGVTSGSGTSGVHTP